MQQQKEQERKDRTKRLCKRAGLLESLLPGTIPLTDEQFKAFLEKTLITEHSRHILTEIQAEPIHPIPSQSTAKYLKSVLNGRDKIPLHTWKAETAQLTDEKDNLYQQYYALKEEVKEVEVIRRNVESVARGNELKVKTRPTHDAEL